VFVKKVEQSNRGAFLKSAFARENGYEVDSGKESKNKQESR